MQNVLLSGYSNQNSFNECKIKSCGVGTDILFRSRDILYFTGSKPGLAMLQKDLSELTKDELLTLIRKAEAGKHYGLVWEEDRIAEKSVAECAAGETILAEIKTKGINSGKTFV